MLYENGESYEGQWRDDKREGRGILLGNWLGVSRTAGNDVYDGQWRGDMKNGEGRAKAKA